MSAPNTQGWRAQPQHAGLSVLFRAQPRPSVTQPSSRGPVKLVRRSRGLSSRWLNGSARSRGPQVHRPMRGQVRRGGCDPARGQPARAQEAPEQEARAHEARGQPAPEQEARAQEARGPEVPGKQTASRAVRAYRAAWEAECARAGFLIRFVRAALAAALSACTARIEAGTITSASSRTKSVSCFVFLNDRSRNTAPLAHLVAPLTCPLPNFRAALAAWARARLAPPSAAARSACMLDVSAEAVVQILSMR
jgi:hypothetical protein